MEHEFMSVGELAKRMGISVRTLQYYDKEGLLSPATHSEGGRRLYSQKDMVKLHQILSFKYLGFSLEDIRNKLSPLDTPEEVAELLSYQRRGVDEQISRLKEISRSLTALQDEVLAMKEVDFKKYADIIALLRAGNEYYWIWKLMDPALETHIQQKISIDPKKGQQILDAYLSLVDEVLKLKQQGIPPESPEGVGLAKRWWQMVMDFTGGDLKLLDNLLTFNQDKSAWNPELAQKQKEIDTYLAKMTEAYMIEQGTGQGGDLFSKLKDL
jgi:DNA-binding transcriptional MerR regulator